MKPLTKEQQNNIEKYLFNEGGDNMESISRKVRRKLEELETDKLEDIKNKFDEKIECDDEDCWLDDCFICGSNQVALYRGNIGCNCYLCVEQILKDKKRMAEVKEYFGDKTLQ